MDEEKRPQPKIPLVFVIAGIFLFVIIDVLGFIPGVGDVLDVPTALIDIFVLMAGVGGLFVLVSDAIELICKAIPASQEFPTATPAWLITVGFDRFSYLLPERIRKSVDEASKVAQQVEGGASGELGGAEGALQSAQSVESAAVEAQQIEQQASTIEGAVSTETRGEFGEVVTTPAEGKKAEGGVESDNGADLAGGGSEDEGQEGGEGEDGEEPREKTPQELEQEKLDAQIEGNFIKLALDEDVGTNSVSEDIENESKPSSGQGAKVLPFDANRKVTTPTPRPARQENDNRYNKEAVDLREEEAA